MKIAAMRSGKLPQSKSLGTGLDNKKKWTTRISKANFFTDFVLGKILYESF